MMRQMCRLKAAYEVKALSLSCARKLFTRFCWGSILHWLGEITKGVTEGEDAAHTLWQGNINYLC